MYRLFLLLIGTVCLPLQAGEVYMSRDANGNVVFSDQPSANSQKHEVRELPSMPALVVPQAQPAKPPKPVAEVSYTSLAIVSPHNGYQLASGYAGNLDVSGVLSPGLKESDTLILLDNGSQVASGRQTSFSLSNLSRGEHQLQMAVTDAQGKTLISSNPVTVYVQRSSVLKRAN